MYGSQLDPRKIITIKKILTPKITTNVQEFWGLIGYCR
jgi:hypothetical protein